MIQQTLDLLGKRGRDRVTGLEGVIDSVCFDLYGCVQVSLKQAVKDGKLESGYWFDVHRIEVTAGERVMPVPDFKAIATKPEEYTHGPADKPAPR